MTTPTPSAAEREQALNARRDQAAQRAADASAKLAQLEQQHHDLLVAGSLSAADQLVDELNQLRSDAANATADVERITAAQRVVNLERQADDARTQLALRTEQRDAAVAETRKAEQEAHAHIKAAHEAIRRAARNHDTAGNHAFHADELAHHLRVLEVGSEQANDERGRFYWARGDRLVESHPAWHALVELHKQGAL